LLGCLCLECSSLILSLTDLCLSAGVRLRLSLLCLFFGVSNHLLGARIRISQLGGRARFCISQLLLSSFACFGQHRVRFRTSLIGQTVSHILGKTQDACCLHMGLWGCCAGGTSSASCCPVSCRSCRCSSGRRLRGLQLGVFLLSCFQFLANLSCLILSSLNLSTGVSGYRSSSWLRRLGLLSFSLSLRCLILGLISFCLGISQLLLVFCAKFRFNRLAY